VTVWYGILATGRTPRPVLEKLNAGFVQAIHSPEVRQQLSAMGLEPVGNSAAEFTKTVRSEIRQWGDVIRRAGIKPESK
jgi:tripartite-type tricarboxylate transporter receptor subunit TctC